MWKLECVCPECSDCGFDLVALTTFTEDESPPSKSIECRTCQMLTLEPKRQLSPDDLWKWLYPSFTGWDLVGPAVG